MRTALALVVILWGPGLYACEALGNLIGWTVIAVTDVDKDQLRAVSTGETLSISLRNGMTFRFNDQPRDTWGFGGFKTSVYVFTRSLSDAEAAYLKKHNLPQPQRARYSLIINGTTYEVERLKSR